MNMDYVYLGTILLPASLPAVVVGIGRVCKSVCGGGCAAGGCSLRNVINAISSRESERKRMEI